MKTFKCLFNRGFTLIEVLIAVLVLSAALGASIQAIGNYTYFQGNLAQKYYAQIVVWNAFMDCYLLIRLNEKGECQTSGRYEQGNGYWEWEARDQEGELFIRLPANDDDEVTYPMTIRTIKVYAPESDQEGPLAQMTAILSLEKSSTKTPKKTVKNA